MSACGHYSISVIVLFLAVLPKNSRNLKLISKQMIPGEPVIVRWLKTGSEAQDSAIRVMDARFPTFPKLQ